MEPGDDRCDSPELPPASDRPPGGTRRSGAKTPRKVQWVFDDQERMSEPGSSRRELDEYGVDPEPLRTLTDALERHQSVTPHNFNAHAPTMLATQPSEPTSPDLTPTYDVPGETFIDRNETAGLPGTDIEKYSQQQAEKFVSAHKRGFFGRMSRHRDSAPKHRKEEKRHKKRGFFRTGSDDDSETDIEMRADSRASSTPTPTIPGRGVLSALLQLYEHPTGTASGASTPGMSTPGVMTPTRSSLDDSFTPPFARESTFSSMKSASSRIGMGLGNPAQWAKSLAIGDSRPPQTRNAAGVFGPLIASTGNITGAAAPVPSTIAPSVKRPGYHLSRYSLESNIPTVSRPEAAKKKALQRPRSTHFEKGPVISVQPSSPPSPGTTGTNNGSPDSQPSVMTTSSKWSGMLKNLPQRSWTRTATPSTPGTPSDDEWLNEKYNPDQGKRSSYDERRKEKRRKRKKAEIYITRHVAEIVARQEFILKLARAMMMFGGPTHRLQAQIQATAKVLDIELSCLYLPDTMLISFDDSATSTSNIKFIRQGSALDIGKLQEAHLLYWDVTHDNISVNEASTALDELMIRKPLYNMWQLVLIGGFCSASICSVSFNGSFIDSLISFPLGCLLIIIQLIAARNELYSNVFEITVATLFSFIAAALASTHHFCYSAVASASVVLILPGFIVLCGSLELASRNIVSGAVRLCFSLVYSLFLGFGLAIGAEAFQKMTHVSLESVDDDLTCSHTHHPDGPWWQRTPSTWWAFLTVPMYSLFLSLRNQAPWNHKEMVFLILVSCAGWASNHFTGLRFPGQSDVSAAVGALAVGFLANLYGRFSRGNAFVIMITAILFQLPSGLANGGLFTFVSQQDNGSDSSTSYLSGFSTALQLISVSIGLTVGLGISIVLVHPIPSRRRAGGVFSL